MAQRKKKLLRRKKRDHELQSDDEEFEVATRVKDDQDTVSLSSLNEFDLDYIPAKQTKQYNKHHHRVSNGLTGYNGTCTGFNGNCNGSLVTFY